MTSTRRGPNAHLLSEIERLAVVAHAMGDAVTVTDSDLRLLAWNRGAERLYGWQRQEVLGRELPQVPAEQRTEIIALWHRALNEGEVIITHEHVALTKRGARVPVLTTLSPLIDGTQQAVGVMAITRDLTSLKALEQQQAVRARLEERERIAMDLHDNTIQAIHGAQLLLAAAERSTDGDIEFIRVAAHQAREHLTVALNELRQYVLKIRPYGTHKRTLSAGLLLLAEQARRNGVDVDLDLDEAANQSIQDDVLDQLLAIAREATSNAIRHAQARTLRLRLTHEEGCLTLIILDDGAFANGVLPSPASGQGQENMVERARRIGARIRIATRPEGTEIRVDFPMLGPSQPR